MGTHSRSANDVGPPPAPPHDPFSWNGPAATTEPAPAPSAATGVLLYAAAPARTRRLPVWAIVVLAVVGGVFLLMVLAAILIPVFLNQRDAGVHKATSVALSGNVGALTQSTDPAVNKVVTDQLGQFEGCGCLEPAVGSVYLDGPGTHRVAVIASRFSRPAHSPDQHEFVRGFWQGAHEPSGGLVVGTPADQDAGALAGTLSCAPLSTSGVTGQMCVSVDPGAVVMVVDMYADGSEPDPALPVTARESVEHRA